MFRPPIEVADVIRTHGEEFLALYGRSLSVHQQTVLKRIADCRTAALGGHVDVCDACGHEVTLYNSCRDRHCPKCQGSSSATWFRARDMDLLSVPYFHVVCTLPHELRPLLYQNKRLLYGLLMKSAAAALQKTAAKPRPLGASIGFFGVLHTWGQSMEFHPHVHFVVPAGGISFDHSRWIPARRNYLVPVRVVSKIFRAKFVDGLTEIYRAGQLSLEGSIQHLAQMTTFRKFIRRLKKKKWLVYSKPPFGGPRQLVKYLARYTHRVAISNRRITGLDESGVTFRYKDYAHGHKKREMHLSGPEFLRRFLLHVLPKGFVRIRHYGFLALRNRNSNVELCRSLIAEAGAVSNLATADVAWNMTLNY